MSERDYLTPFELCERWRGIYSLKTLANWRSSGGGPEFEKIRNRVLYPLGAVREFERRKGIGVEAQRGERT